MLEVKLTGVGTGVAIILPREALAHLQADKGDTLKLIETADGYRLSKHDPAFLDQIDAAQDIMQSMREALQEMSK